MSVLINYLQKLLILEFSTLPPSLLPPSKKDKELVQVKVGMKDLKTDEAKAIVDDLSNADEASAKLILRKKCPNTELFLVGILFYLD